MSRWNSEAIELTLVQLSASSTPVLSAVNPPSDGMTSPPLDRIVLMSAPNVDDAIGMLVSPFHSRVQDPREAVCRNAIVRCLAPDCWDSAAGLCPVQDSKYGAKRRAGNGVAALALVAATPTTVAVTLATTADIASRDLASRKVCSIQRRRCR